MDKGFNPQKWITGMDKGFNPQNWITTGKTFDWLVSLDDEIENMAAILPQDETVCKIVMYSWVLLSTDSISEHDVAEKMLQAQIAALRQRYSE